MEFNKSSDSEIGNMTTDFIKITVLSQFTPHIAGDPSFWIYQSSFSRTQKVGNFVITANFVLSYICSFHKNNMLEPVSFNL